MAQAGQRRNTDGAPLPEFPANLLQFQRMFPDEAACLRYLEQMRWPNGFACEKCTTVGEPFRFRARPRVLQCRSCHGLGICHTGPTYRGLYDGRWVHRDNPPEA
jgi:hypothetical protein